MVKQISVFLENRAGQLADITRVLAEAGIDVRALNIAETADYGLIRIIADRPKAAVGALEKAGYVATTNDMVAFCVPDEKGALSKVLKVLASENIGLSYLYSIFSMSHGKAVMIMKVRDPERVEEILRNNGFHVSDAPELGITEEAEK